MRCLVVALLTMPLLPVPAEAGNTGSNHSSPVQTVNRIRLVPVGWPANRIDQFRAGYQALNAPDCNSNGTSFPELTEGTQGIGRTIEVIYSPGQNPVNPLRCGTFVGNTIRLYTQAQNTNGAIVNCNAKKAIEDSVSHELGHALGLKDNLCGGSAIMTKAAFTASGIYKNRSITSQECSKLRSTLKTQIEVFEEECFPLPVEECFACEITGCSPVYIDLNGDGFAFTNIDSGVVFDIDDDGFPERTSWTNRHSDDVLVVLDRNRNGIIDSGAELFGDGTPFLHGGTAENGYQALSELEIAFGDGDGFVEPEDPIYWRLQVWSDANRNGRTDWGELQGLDEHGISALGTRVRISVEPDDSGNFLVFWGEAYIERDDELEKVDTVDVLFDVEDLSRF